MSLDDAISLFNLFYTIIFQISSVDDANSSKLKPYDL